MRFRAVLSLLAVLGSVAAGAEEKATPTDQQLRHFESAVRPLLLEQCIDCHGAKKQWSGLRLDSREALLKGGDRGPAIVPGKPEESLLILAVKQTDETLEMPPKSKLTERQISDLAKWIKDGAIFPGAAAAQARTRDPNHWAFHPPKPTSPPAVNNTGWPQTAIDHFVLARLEKEGLTPTVAADKRTLIRRATFDLTGLPPTPDEVDAFLADARPGAFERVVDRLLASPAYGERWARHWLDVARYADSNGLDENVCFGNAWRYRDYVVQAFNADKPFDQFLVEQLAGDLLPTDDTALRNERLSATGFLVLGGKVLAEVDETKMEMDIVDEQIDVVGRAFLGMTFGCARCHDHKFDPISTADYYGLSGIFKSTRTMDSFRKIGVWHENPIATAEGAALKAAYDARLAEKKGVLQKFIEAANASVKAEKSGESLPEKLETLYPESTKVELKKLRDELAAIEKAPPELPAAMGATEGKVVDVAIHVRGSHLKLGDVAPRHVPGVFTGAPAPEFTSTASGRLELSKWLVDPRHPLTARVFANRLWRWHFGKGLVASIDNFGLLGSNPSHPELLDWLALEIQGTGDRQPDWSLKRLHRMILLSATWQQSSIPAAGSAERDPENRLYARASIRRLEAESVRDSLIAVGGRLDQTMGGSLLTHVKNRGYFFDHTSKDLTDYTSWRRSIYLPVVRNNVYDVLQLLDFPDPTVSSGDRSSTTVAPQALLMMNSDLVERSSAELAARLLAAPAADDVSRIRRLYAITYGREATGKEIESGRRLLAEIAKAFEAAESDAAKRQTAAWESLCQVVLAGNEFIYIR